MKTRLGRFPLFTLLLIAAQVQAQSIKVFSKYNYYTTEKVVIILGDPGDASADRFRLSVYKSEDLLGTTDSLVDGLLRIHLPLIAFAPGRTTLQYTVSNNDKTIGRDTIDIVRLRPQANEVKIDLQTGGLIADGMPFFPFGFYCGGNVLGLANEVTHGFTHMAPYQSNLPETFAERKAYMDRCAQVGMRVAYSVNSLIGSGHNGARGLSLTEDQKLEILKNEIIAFRDHPALLCWYINDEPDGQGRPPALLEKAYQFVHELDPYHPVSIVFMLPPKFGLYRNAMDIAMTDPYPIPGPVSMVEEHVQELNKLYTHEKSVWLVPQAFGGQEMWAREPTPKEIRVMTYLGLVNGVKGIQYYTHAPANLNPQSVAAWSACSDMAVEVQQMAGFLLSDEPEPAVRSSDAQTLVHAFVHNGDLLILAVNKENKPKTIRIQLDEESGWLTDSSVARLWFENRELGFTGGGLDDMIDAMSTRVYLVKGKTQEPSLIYPGNLTANPGFENIVSPGLPIGSNTKMSFSKKGDPAATFFADPRQHKEGRFSLRLTTPVDSGGSRIRLLPIVLKAGNSYRVSIWAKAKQQDRMPVLRLGVEGPRQEQTFWLTHEWQRYSFLLRSDSSWSAAIVNIDLVTAGTAWVDAVQVNADPVISYTINADKKAVVSLSTTMPGSNLRYSIGGKEIVYSKPFFIDKATLVQAGLYTDGKPLATASLFVPVSKALGKPVTLQNGYAPQYAGAGPSSLTDGLMGSTAFKDNKWLGFLGRDVVATIDLQEAVTVNSVAVNFLCDPNSGIFLPPDLSLYTSLNGKDFVLADRSVTTIEQRMGEPSLQMLRLDGKKVKARYIRVVAAAFGEIPEGYLFKGTQSWIFTDEIMVE